MLFNAKTTLVWAILLVLLSSCNKKDADDNNITPTLGKYESGVFIINQGPFQNGTGTISFYDRSTGKIINDIFNIENQRPLGNIVQSMAIHNKKAYIVVNNADKVEIADAAAFKTLATLTDVAQPRYFLPISDTKAYISEWGKDYLTGAIKVLDLQSNKISNTILTGKGADYMLKVGDKVYVSNAGGFGTDSTLAVIDVLKESVIKKINVGVYPRRLQLDKNGAVWLITGGDWQNAAPNDARLVKIENDVVTKKIALPKYSGELTINSAKDQLYFVVSNKIMQMSITADKPTNFNNFGASGLGYDTKSNVLFAVKSRNNNNGILYRFKPDGTAIDSLEVGIFPSEFYFN